MNQITNFTEEGEVVSKPLTKDDLVKNMDPGHILFGTTQNQLKWKYLVTTGHSLYARMNAIITSFDWLHVLIECTVVVYIIYYLLHSGLLATNGVQQGYERDTAMPSVSINMSEVQKHSSEVPAKSEMIGMVKAELDSLNKTKKLQFAYYTIDPANPLKQLGDGSKGINSPIMLRFPKESKNDWPERMWISQIVKDGSYVSPVWGMYFKDIDDDKWKFISPEGSTYITGAKKVPTAGIYALIEHDLKSNMNNKGVRHEADYD